MLLALPVAEALLPFGVAMAGIGLGLSSVDANTVGTAVPEALEGTAAGALNTGAQLGTAVGVSVLLLLATGTAGSALPLAGAPAARATAAGLAAAAAAALVARSSAAERARPASR